MVSYNKSNPETIQKMFGSIAQQYDHTNAVLSFHMHHWWNRKLIQTVMNENSSGTLLDLCCGTGEIGLTFLKKKKDPQKVILLDFCDEMLQCAKQKAIQWKLLKHDISYIQSDAQALPLSNESIERVTIAYGIRNIKSPQACIQETFRVLKPGGKLAILELTEPHHPILRYSHSLYLRKALPLLGKFLTSNEEAYQYLCQSIKSFIKPLEVQKILKDTGFENTQCVPLTGGIATILVGEKPILYTK